jgi:hypothetical protein
VTRQIVQAVVIGVWFLAGAAVEVLNAWTRRRMVDQLAPDRRMRSVGWLTGGFFLRVVLTAGVLVLAFRHSFASGLVAWLGYYVCRTVLVMRMSRRMSQRSKRPSAKSDLDIGSENG